MPEDPAQYHRGVMTVDGGLVKTWSSMQATVAQSSGEAEYYAVVRAAAEALGLQAIMRDLRGKPVFSYG